MSENNQHCIFLSTYVHNFVHREFKKKCTYTGCGLLLAYHKLKQSLHYQERKNKFIMINCYKRERDEITILQSNIILKNVTEPWTQFFINLVVENWLNFLDFTEIFLYVCTNIWLGWFWLVYSIQYPYISKERIVSAWTCNFLTCSQQVYNIYCST